MSIYLRVLIIGLFFFYQLGLNNILLAFNEPLKEAFNLSASHMGFLGSLYFWGDIIFLLPAGYLVDHAGARRVVLSVMALSAGLVLLAALIPQLYVFGITRFLEGACGGFGMIGALKLGTFYVEKKKFALMSGIITTLGMFGSFMSSMPLTLLVEKLDWRLSLVVMAVMGAGIFVLLFLATQKKPTQKINQNPSTSLKKILPKVLKNTQIFLNASYVCLINLPLYILAALWGEPMLKSLTHVSSSTAALIISMLFVGNMIGAPIFGFLSDHFKQRKIFLFIGAGLGFILVSLMILTGLQQVAVTFILFLCLGFATSTQSLSFAIVMEQNSPEMAGCVSAVLAMVSALGGAIGQPLFGALLSWLQNLGLSTPEAYLKLCYLFLGALLITLIATWRIKSK